MIVEQADHIPSPVQSARSGSLRSPGRVRLLGALLAGILMLMLLIVQDELVGLAPSRFQMLARLLVGAVAAGLGAATVYWGTTALFRQLDGEVGVLVRNLATWILYVLVGLGIASAMGVNLSALLLGGAIAGVVAVAAAQALLSNFLAGLVLLLARPLQVGTAVHLRGSDLGEAEPEGTVTNVDSLYTTLASPDGETIKIPNHTVANAMLTLRAAPVQAEVEVLLPATTALGPVADALASRLGPPDCTVTIRALLLEAEKGRLRCQLRVRGRSVVDPAVLAQALSACLAPDRPLESVE